MMVNVLFGIDGRVTGARSRDGPAAAAGAEQATAVANRTSSGPTLRVRGVMGVSATAVRAWTCTQVMSSRKVKLQRRYRRAGQNGPDGGGGAAYPFGFQPSVPPR